MKELKTIFAYCLSVFFLFLDGQLSLFSGYFLPTPYSFTTFIWLLWGMMLLRESSIQKVLLWSILFGFLFDLIYLQIAGVTVFILPILLLLAFYYLNTFSFNMLSFGLVSLVLIFFFEGLLLTASFVLEGARDYIWFTMITHFFPTIVVNYGLSFVVYVIYSRMFKKDRHLIVKKA